MLWNMLCKNKCTRQSACIGSISERTKDFLLHCPPTALALQLELVYPAIVVFLQLKESFRANCKSCLTVSCTPCCMHCIRRLDRWKKEKSIRVNNRPLCLDKVNMIKDNYKLWLRNTDIWIQINFDLVEGITGSLDAFLPSILTASRYDSAIISTPWEKHPQNITVFASACSFSDQRIYFFKIFVFHYYL